MKGKFKKYRDDTDTFEDFEFPQDDANKKEFLQKHCKNEDKSMISYENFCDILENGDVEECLKDILVINYGGVSHCFSEYDVIHLLRSERDHLGNTISDEAKKIMRKFVGTRTQNIKIHINYEVWDEEWDRVIYDDRISEIRKQLQRNTFDHVLLEAEINHLVYEVLKDNRTFYTGRVTVYDPSQRDPEIIGTFTMKDGRLNDDGDNAAFLGETASNAMFEIHFRDGKIYNPDGLNAIELTDFRNSLEIAIENGTYSFTGEDNRPQETFR
jgi:hypothetical protein